MMGQARGGSRFHADRPAAPYVAVIGVTVGMLLAGLSVPLVFGRVRSSDQLASPAQVPSAPSGVSVGATPSPGAVSGPLPVATSAAGKLPAGRSSGAAGPSGPGPSAGPGGLSASGRASRLTATDQGVTASTIKLGVVLIDVQALQPLGFTQPHFAPQEQQQQYQFFIDQVNRAGGINGRKLVPDYVTWNALDTNGSQSAGAVCVKLAEDDKVFAAIGVIGGQIDTCLTETYGIPAVPDGSEIAEDYTKSHHLLATRFASLERLGANWGDLAVRSGITRGHKTGTASGATAQVANPEQALVAALAADGQPVTYRAHLGSDPATAQSQLPIEVRKMQAAGVDTVFLSLDFASAIQFVQTADKQSFHPRYVVSDVGALTAEGLVHDMPSSFNGAYAFTQNDAGNGVPESAPDRQCRTTFNAATGNHYAAGSESFGVYQFCMMVTLMTDGMKAAGADLTRPRVALGFQTLTGIALPGALPGTLRSGKTDYSNDMRLMRYSTACTCYNAAGGTQQGRY